MSKYGLTRVSYAGDKVVVQKGDTAPLVADSPTPVAKPPKFVAPPKALAKSAPKPAPAKVSAPPLIARPKEKSDGK